MDLQAMVIHCIIGILIGAMGHDIKRKPISPDPAILAHRGRKDGHT
jgi:hypothetical protein